VRACIAVAVFLATSATTAAAASDIEQVTATANGFYAAYATFHPSDGIPNAKSRAKLEPFVSPALDRLLIDGEAAEARFARVTRNMSPPLVEGDLFTSNFEGATAYHVGPCQTAGDTARCPVALGYRDNAKEDARRVNWTDMLYLVRTATGWRIDDIFYGATWDFGNRGRLSDTLKSAIHDGNSATP
jgi:hypothetical protein